MFKSNNKIISRFYKVDDAGLYGTSDVWLNIYPSGTISIGFTGGAQFYFPDETTEFIGSAPGTPLPHKFYEIEGDIGCIVS